MLMIQNNLDYVAQHPHELITYGGNGAVFQNWAQYLLTCNMSEMTDEQTLTMYSGHPMGLFLPIKKPKSCSNKRNGYPNYSKPDDWEK
jgi:urocanate hydratase